MLRVGAMAKDLRDLDGRTPLSWAASRGHENVVRLLVSAGAAVNLRDNYGWTPLSYAIVELRKNAAYSLCSSQIPLDFSAAERHCRLRADGKRGDLFKRWMLLWSLRVAWVS